MVTHNLENIVFSRLNEAQPLIQIVLGPRQVGKTTAVDHLIKSKKLKKVLFLNGDGIVDPYWIDLQWQKALDEEKILVIDEIQKIPNWSEHIKKLWDSSKKKQQKIKCLLLGSSSLQLQKGLSESLTGRFEMIQACHWAYQESNALKKMSLDNFLIFGGYPGSYKFIKSAQRWKDYLTSSIVETVVAKDILTQAQVKNPGLFRQSFYIFTQFVGQTVSYNKILGQLQDKGNIDLVKYYLDLFSNAFLFQPIFRFTRNEVKKKQSSPKIIVMAPALSTFSRLDHLNSDFLGRVFESLVGAQLLKSKINVYYWTEGDYEVDFVVLLQNKLLAIEVKSGRTRKPSSLNHFIKKYPDAIAVFITKENYLAFEKNPHKFLEKFI